MPTCVLEDIRFVVSPPHHGRKSFEPWLPGCRVLPGGAAGLPVGCRLAAGLPGCRVLLGAAGCCTKGCQVAAGLVRAASTSGCCRVLPGAAGLPGCRVTAGSLPGVTAGSCCRVVLPGR